MKSCERPRVAVSIGDLNGIGIALALHSHSDVCRRVNPLYLIDEEMLAQAAERLRLPIPSDFEILSPDAAAFLIRPGEICAESGAYAYASFKTGVELCAAGEADALCTLPIHKEAWSLAGIPYKGHTDALRDFFDAEAIMMLGCPQMYVGLFTEHIPLRAVPARIDETQLIRFLLDFQRNTGAESIAVLGLNPHAGDGGVLGNEEKIITRAIDTANQTLRNNSTSKMPHSELFVGPLVPDTAFTPAMRRKYTYYVALYHDQGLIPLKALHFDESINVSLNLPILRTSVDHGTAFDIAYSDAVPNNLSYLNALEYIRHHSHRSSRTPHGDNRKSSKLAE